jgi:hypothetical protein
VRTGIAAGVHELLDSRARSGHVDVPQRVHTDPARDDRLALLVEDEPVDGRVLGLGAEDHLDVERLHEARRQQEQHTFPPGRVRRRGVRHAERTGELLSLVAIGERSEVGELVLEEQPGARVLSPALLRPEHGRAGERLGIAQDVTGTEVGPEPQLADR